MDYELSDSSGTSSFFFFFSAILYDRPSDYGAGWGLIMSIVPAALFSSFFFWLAMRIELRNWGFDYGNRNEFLGEAGFKF